MVGLCATAALAQDNKPAEGDQPADVFMWAERGVLQKLTAAQELLKQGRYGEAARYLGVILEAPEDYFVQTSPGDTTYQSLKTEAHRLIGKMPNKGRESYELQFGARARQLLAEATAKGDANILADITRRFFHTKAGYQAAIVLGFHDLDRGHPLVGAMMLQRLHDQCPEAETFEPTLSLALATAWFEAGATDKAAQVLRQWRRTHSAKDVNVAGRSVALFGENADPLPWLKGLLGERPPRMVAESSGWLMFRGDPARNAARDASAPLLNPRWRVPLADDPVTENYLQQRRQHLRDRGLPDSPSLHPLAVGNVVLMRTVQNLLAVDFVTGKRLWEVPADVSIENLLDTSGSEPMFQQSPVALGLEQRVWDDATYGTLSSDGRSVFSIEDLGVGAGLSIGRQVLINGRRQVEPGEPMPYNRLTAYDIRTGKLKWHLGGAGGSFPLRMAETFFLGPPLPLADRLYVLAEVKEELRLLALDADTGDLLWSQQLAMVEQNVVQDSLRRLSGVSPSYADGLLVCPTCSGAVVAVELATRCLLWGYRYSKNKDSGQASNPFAARMAALRGDDPADRWLETAVTIAGGRVILGPSDSDDIHCLNLLDGRLLWKQPHEDDLYVGGVDDDRVVIVGKTRVRALRLEDGKSAWSRTALDLPETSVTSGRGFLSGHTYFLPTSSAEVLAIDLVEGRVARTSKSRDGAVPGNLICHQGRILSQGIDGLDCYYQLDALRAIAERRLEQRADDPEALAFRGEVLAEEGNRGEAISCLRRSWQLASDVRTRELLRDTLMDGLRSDFARYENEAKELEPLLDNPTQKFTFYRLMANGLQQARRSDQSLEFFRRMIALDQQSQASRDDRRMESVSRSLSVRRDRWLRTQLTALQRTGSAEIQAELKHFANAQAQAASDVGTIDSLRRFLDYFGQLPASDEVRKLLLERLKQSGRYLEAELLLWQELASAEPQRAAAVTAELAIMFRGAGRTEAAAALYAQLSQQFAEVDCGDGKTGRQLFEELPDDDPIRNFLTGSVAWPVGAVEVAKLSTDRSQSYYARFPIKFREGQTPFFTETGIQFDQNRHQMQARDGFGTLRWQISLADPGKQPVIGFNHTLSSISARGHLLVASLDYKLAAIDACGTGNSRSPRMIWSQDLGESGLSPLRGMQNRLPMLIPGWRLQMMQMNRPVGAQPSLTGAIIDEQVCFQKFRDCVAVAPLDGEPLWVRHDIPQGSMLFGDDRYVFVLPPDQKEAIVLHAADGGLAQLRKVPPMDEWLALRGRHILVWRPEGERVTLAQYDPWSRRDIWKIAGLNSQAKSCMVDDRAVAVLEPDGHFVLVAVQSGQRLVEGHVASESALAEIFVFAYGQQYLLVTSRTPPQSAALQSTQPIPGMNCKPITSGLVYALDRQGQSVWPKPVKIENQHVLLNQPDQIPVLTFACQPFERKWNGAGEYLISILCIDKRTGRVVLRESLRGHSTLFDLSADPDQHTVDIRLQQSTFRLKFTDRPVSDQAEPTGQPGAGFWDALMKAAAEAMEAKDQEKGAGGNPLPPPQKKAQQKAEEKPQPDPKPAQR